MKNEIPKETTARFHNLENVAVSNKPTAGAGRVLTFPADRETESLALPADLAQKARKGTVDLVTLEGNSLEGVGIYDGDQVLCQTAVSRRQIKSTSICIVYLPDTDETLAKRVIYRNGVVILRSFNPLIADITLRPEQVEVQGIVLKLLRDPDTEGTFIRAPKLQPSLSAVERNRKIAELVQRLEKPEKNEELPF